MSSRDSFRQTALLLQLMCYFEILLVQTHHELIATCIFFFAFLTWPTYFTSHSLCFIALSDSSCTLLYGRLISRPLIPIASCLYLLSDLIANQSSLRLSHHYHLTWVVQQRVWKVSWVVHQCVWKVSERSLRDLWEVCSSITKGEFGIRLEILGDLLRDSPLKLVNQSNPYACDLCKVVIQ